MKECVDTTQSLEILENQQATAWDMRFQGQGKLIQATGTPIF